MTNNKEAAWLKTMTLGQLAYQKQAFNKAYDLYLQSVLLMPSKAEGWVNLAETCSQLYKYDLAREFSVRAINLNPSLAQPYLILGDCYSYADETEKANQAYTKAISRSRHPAALFRLACCLARQARHTEAEQLLIETLELSPGFEQARLALIKTLINLKRADEAEKLSGQWHWQQQETQKAARELNTIANEYQRVSNVFSDFSASRSSEKLINAIGQTPSIFLEVDDSFNARLKTYAESLNTLHTSIVEAFGSHALLDPAEACFMIPITESPEKVVELRTSLFGREAIESEQIETANMLNAIRLARASHKHISTDVEFECYLRSVHFEASRGLDNFHAGHFKFVQNQTKSCPFDRSTPEQTAGTIRDFFNSVYLDSNAGLARAALIFMAISDIHPFPDGNSRVAITCMNRELESCGLMPAFFSRASGITGSLALTIGKLRNNPSDTRPLIEAIIEGQKLARSFCLKLASLQSRTVEADPA